jgi:hypothetical protein
MKKSKQVKVGDIIQSEKFCIGSRDSSGVLSVGEGNKLRSVKPDSLFVVTEAKFGGGGTGMGPNDVYPDAWQVTAQMLNNGKYDPKGVTINFHQQTTCYHFTIDEVNVVGKLTKVVDFV